MAVGDALAVLAEASPDVRIVNLETSVTTSDDFAPGKQVHYRMHPANLPALSVARPDACVLANNHVVDVPADVLALQGPWHRWTKETVLIGRLPGDHRDIAR